LTKGKKQEVYHAKYDVCFEDDFHRLSWLFGVGYVYIYIYLFRRILMINSFKEMHLKRDENKINIIKKINKFLYLISSSKFGISIIKKKYL